MAIETRRGAGTARERAMRRVLERGERDGLTVRAMAVHAGMPAGTLAWWRSEIRRRDAARVTREEPPVFIEVVAAAAHPEPAQAGATAVDAGADDDEPTAFEIELRGGRRLRVAASYGLARLVREIEACRRRRCRCGSSWRPASRI